MSILDGRFLGKYNILIITLGNTDMETAQGQAAFSQNFGPLQFSESEGWWWFRSQGCQKLFALLNYLKSGISSESHYSLVIVFGHFSWTEYIHYLTYFLKTKYICHLVENYYSWTWFEIWRVMTTHLTILVSCGYLPSITFTFNNPTF